MSDFKFKLNSKGVRELLKGQAMQNLLTEKASEIKNRAGDGYEQDVKVGKNRANAKVYPDSAESYFKNLKHNTLLKAIK